MLLTYTPPRLIIGSCLVPLVWTSLLKQPNYTCSGTECFARKLLLLVMRFKFAARFSTTIETLIVKTQEFGLKNPTGLRKGAVESEVLVSNVSDGLRLCKRDVSV